MFWSHVSGMRLKASFAWSVSLQPKQKSRGQIDSLCDIYLARPLNSMRSDSITIRLSACVGANPETEYPIGVFVISARLIPGNEQITIFFPIG
jgi:hypothetical protein